MHLLAQPLQAFNLSSPLPFVGRRAYIEYLVSVLESIKTGQPTVLCIEGEAGIGKTRLLDACHGLARQQGLTLYTSRCYEETMLPYGPFVEACQDLKNTVCAELPGVSAADLAVLRQCLGGQPLLSALGQVESLAWVEQARFRLFRVFTHVLIALAQQRPTLLSIDDLHWADLPSLDLFMYLVSALATRTSKAPLPLGIIVTHRPLDPQERLARILLRCERTAIYQSLLLQAFNDTELLLLLQALGIARPSARLLHTFATTTAGCPLFVQEMQHYLAQRQAFQTHQGETVLTVAASELRLPGKVTEALLARTAQLPAASYDTLAYAALLGEVFDVQTLSAVLGISEDVTLEHLDQALRHQLLSSEGQTFQFMHPLLRHALEHQPSPAQRQRRHWHIAQTLMTLYRDDLDEHQGLQIVRHLIAAGTAASTEAIVQYGRRAGDYAFMQCDWPAAAQAYSATLTAMGTQGQTHTEAFAAIAARAGLACERDGDYEGSDTYHDQAVAVYHHLGDLHGVARALIPKTLRLANAAYGELVDTSPLETLLEEAEAGSCLRGRIATALSEIYWAGQQPQQAEHMALKGLTVGQKHHNWSLCARASFNLGLAQADGLRFTEAIQKYLQAHTYASQAQNAFLASGPLQRMTASLMMLGRFEEARAIAKDAYALAAQTMNWRDYSLTLSALSALTLHTGAFEETECWAQDTMTLVARYRLPFGGVFAMVSLACAHALRGAWDAAHAALDALITPGHLFERPRPFYSALVQLYCHLMQTTVPTWTPSADSEHAWRQLSLPTTCTFRSLTECCVLVELSAAYGDATRSAALYRLLAPVVQQGVLFTREWGFCVPRVLGLAASLNGWWEQAESHLQMAITTTTQLGAAPECGRAHLDYAEMLRARGAPCDVSRARESAQQAALICQRLGMLPLLQRAERLIQALESCLTLPPTYCDSFSPYERAVLARMTHHDFPYLQ